MQRFWDSYTLILRKDKNYATNGGINEQMERQTELHFGVGTYLEISEYHFLIIFQPSTTSIHDYNS